MEPLPALTPVDGPGVGDTAPVASPTSETPDAGAPRKKPAKRRSDYEP